jgi:hypothetical protein
VHNNIQPANLLMGSTKETQQVLHIIDFQFMTKYIDPSTGVHSLFQSTGKGFTSNCFASLNANSGQTTSRRDDLEAIGYVLVFLLKGMLPWYKVRGPAKVVKRKAGLELSVLCEGLPLVFSSFLSYSRALPFDGAPDYAAWRKTFKDTLATFGFTADGVYDWSIVGPSQEAAASATTAPKLTDAELCKVCMLSSRNALLLPCRHFGLCATCAKQLSTCPFCQKHIVSLELIYPQ